MASPPPQSPNPLKRPSLSSTASQPLVSKRPRVQHPLRQTSFPNTVESDLRGFGTATPSDAGSVTGSLTGSVGGASSVDGVFAAKVNKKRGRKSKVEKEREKEREREREDAMTTTASSRAGATGGGGGGRMGSVDDGSVVAGAGGGGGGGGSTSAGGAARGGAEDGDVDDDEDFDEGEEGELLGGEEGGVTDAEAEKKNLAYVPYFPISHLYWFQHVALLACPD